MRLSHALCTPARPSGLWFSSLFDSGRCFEPQGAGQNLVPFCSVMGEHDVAPAAGQFLTEGLGEGLVGVGNSAKYVLSFFYSFFSLQLAFALSQS